MTKKKKEISPYVKWAFSKELESEVMRDYQIEPIWQYRIKAGVIDPPAMARTSGPKPCCCCPCGGVY